MNRPTFLAAISAFGAALALPASGALRSALPAAPRLLSVSPQFYHPGGYALSWFIGAANPGAHELAFVDDAGTIIAREWMASGSTGMIVAPAEAVAYVVRTYDRRPS